jgi:predicted DNA-binding WGR domain protein
MSVLKLYRFADEKKEYWETWEDETLSHTIHWGELGTRGESKTVKSTLFTKAEKAIQKEIDHMVSLGFRRIDSDALYTLLIEYAIDGMGTEDDIDKRHRLESRMNETLGWTGLGECDGGSIGSGSMEVCTFVVDFDVAKAVITQDLAGTEFANYTRIFDENA